MKFLILGDGSAGKRHAGHLASRGHEVEILGPFDRSTTSGFHGIVIATPPEFHERTLTNYDDWNILCEGPCTWLPQPNTHVQMMASNWRFVPALQAFKKRLTNPLLAHFWFDYDLNRWRKDFDPTKSCYYWSGHDLINVHEVDMAFWFFGPAERLSVEKIYTGKSRECDGFQMLIKHRSGVVSSICSSWHSQHYRRGVYVVQRDGTVEETSWKTPADDPTVNASYGALVDHWLDHIERRDPLIAPNLLDGYRAYKALQGVCI